MITASATETIESDPLRRHHELARVHAVGHDPCREAEHGERHEPPEDERPDSERGSGELEHEPGERDVLHPRAGKGDELPGEEDPVVAVPREAPKRARPECDRERGHASSPSRRRSAGIAASTALELGGLESTQVVGEPGGAPRANPPHEPLSVLGEPKPHPAPIFGRANTLEKPCGLEPVDVSGQGRRGDAFLPRELREREPGTPLDEPEQCRLARGHSELLRLLAQLARKSQQHRPEIGCDLLRVNRNLD